MGYDESFENIANEESVEQSFDDTYQEHATLSEETDNMLNENPDTEEQEDYSPHGEMVRDETMDKDVADEDYEEAMAAGAAVAAGASHSHVGYDDGDEHLHNSLVEDDEAGDRGIDEKDEINDLDLEEGTFQDEEEYELGEAEEMLEYDPKPGDINCCCVPIRVTGVKDLFLRTALWTKLNKDELLGGVTVSLAQVPESISAALIAGVDPALALQATWILNLMSTIVGGRTGMMSGASGTVAIVLMNLVKDHGVEYVFHTVVFAGLLQIIFGFLGLGAIVRLVPHPVQTGFANAMALLIVALQLRFWRVTPEETLTDGGRKFGHSWENFTDKGSEWAETSTGIVMVIEALVSIIITFVLSKFRATRIVPSAFVAIIIVTIADVILRQFGHRSYRIMDYGDVKIEPVQTMFASQNRVPLNWDTFEKIYLTAIAVFGVSLIETLMASNILDELSGTRAQRNRVAVGIGAGNVVAGIMGGMGGSASIGMVILTNLSGAYTRLSSFVAAGCFTLFVHAAPEIVNHIPLAAIAGVMFYVAIKLFRWYSILQVIAAMLPQRIREILNLDCKIARADIIIMLLVMAVSLIFDFGIAVLAGVTMAVFFFVWDSSNRIVIEKEVIEEEGTVTYNISGQLFFATAQGFVDTFAGEDFGDDPEEIVIMLEGADVYDWSGMKALKTVHDHLVDLGKVVALASISPSSRRLMEKNANMWSGVSFLEVEEIDDDMTSMQSSMKQDVKVDSKQVG